MEKSTIGIKIANGTFFPILEQIDNRKKKVILTPVKSGQKDVKIDIYRGEGQLMLNSTYVASIILNNIESIENESTDIQFFIKINDEGILNAEAFEPLSGEKQLLSINLDSIEENFSIDDSDEDFDTAFSAAINETIDEEDEEDDAWLSEHENRNKGKGLKIAVIILAIIFIILLGMLIYALLVKPALAKNKEQVEVIETVVLIPEPPAPVVEEPKPEPPAPVVEEPKPVPPAPVVEEPKPEPPAPVVEKPKKKAESVRYRIKWGDTLWDISDTYYRTPWLYKKIARDNKIRNPDYIWAGSMLTIKPEE